MFAVADLVVVNKTDLLTYVDFDLNRLADQARSIRSGVQVIALSVRDGTNLDLWYTWLHQALGRTMLTMTWAEGG